MRPPAALEPPRPGATWMGETRGYLSDWLTQRWVQLTGRRIEPARFHWLDGPTGATRGIGPHYYEELAAAEGARVRPEPAGLMQRLEALAGPGFDPGRLDPRVVHFYEHTSEYRLDTWSHWCGAFRPFGWLLAAIFSRRLQQLNIPLSPLDGARGLESRVVVLEDAESGAVRHVGWVRELRATRRVAYVGDYSTARVPGHDGPCVRVVFPLPNGNATVILRPEARADGSLLLRSSGRRFGDPGFYFVVRARDGRGWARYVRTMRETIHVYAEGAELRTDHRFRVFGLQYLHLHYRLERRAGDAAGPVGGSAG